MKQRDEVVGVSGHYCPLCYAELSFEGANCWKCGKNNHKTIPHYDFAPGEETLKAVAMCQENPPFCTMDSCSN